jgi:hypothetical protein
MLFGSYLWWRWLDLVVSGDREGSGIPERMRVREGERREEGRIM